MKPDADYMRNTYYHLVALLIHRESTLDEGKDVTAAKGNAVQDQHMLHSCVEITLVFELTCLMSLKRKVAT